MLQEACRCSLPASARRERAGTLVRAMLSPAALTLDLDDTLLDLSGLANAIDATCRAVASRAPNLREDKLRLANALVWERYWPDVELEWTLGRLTGADLTLEVWRQTLEACGVDEPRLVEVATSVHLGAYRRWIRLYDDARTLLDTVSALDIPLALITNGAGDTQREKLHAVGIEGLFDAIVISGELGVAKPDVRPFQVAMETLGVRGRSAWHVGDSLGSDIAGAKAAGLTSVWLNRAGRARPVGTPAPDIEIRSLEEIVETLEGG